MANIFREKHIDKKEVKNLIKTAFVEHGVTRTAYLLDKLKELGFRHATDSGISIGPEDLKVPPEKKNLIKSGNWFASNLEILCQGGEISKIEKFQGILEIWFEISEYLKTRVVSFFKRSDPLNAVYMMSFSGARGNLTQVHQLLGMRGMMANPSGELIEVPIKTNFREGLTVTDYIISSYGARKGVVDTALRTADAGYLTRRLVDVAQDLVIRSVDCGTDRGLLVSSIRDKEGLVVPLEDRIIGRVLSDSIYDGYGNVLANEGELISQNMAGFLKKLKIRAVPIRSPLTCRLSRAVCSKCYGLNLAHNELITLGEAVGVVAAQSIGEPGTQLTMRTFHTGGVFTGRIRQKFYAKFSGQIAFSSKLRAIRGRNLSGKVIWITQNTSYIKIRGFYNEQVRLRVEKGTCLEINHGCFILRGDPLYEIQRELEYDNSQEANYRIFSDVDGEIYINQKKNNQRILKNGNLLVWILSGVSFSMFKKAKSLIKKNDKLTKFQSISKIEVYNEYEGRINLCKVGKHQKDFNFELSISPVTLDLAPLLVIKDLGKTPICVAGPTKNYKKYLLFEDLKTPKLNQIFGEIINNEYLIPVGGFLNVSYDAETAGEDDDSITCTISTIFYIPEESHEVNLDIKDVFIRDNSFIKKQTKLAENGQKSKTSGLAQTKFKQKKIREIIIKSGRLIKINDKSLFSRFLRMDKCLVYDGEVLVKGLKIKQPTYIETHDINGEIYVLLRPLTYFNIPLNQNEIKDFASVPPKKRSLISVKTRVIIPYFDDRLIKTNESLYLRRSFFSLQTNGKLLDEKKLTTKLIKNEKNIYIEIYCSEKIPFDELIESNIKPESISVSTFFEDGQYIEPYTNFASFRIVTDTNGHIHDIKDRLHKNTRKLLVVRTDNLKQINIQDNENNRLNVKSNDFITLGTPITKHIRSHVSGFITSISGNVINIREGKVYLFSSGAFVYPLNRTFVKKGDLLGLLKYRRARTNDIIQGLPRVEAILEARISKKRIPFNRQPGIISDIKEINKKYFVKINGILNETIKFDQEPKAKVGQFIHNNANLTSESFNAHTILENSFSYFQRYLNLEEASYKSFAKVQLYLLSNVQSVYRSQGVRIADKHIEVIIKKMTSKIRVVDGGLTELLPEELFNFAQIQLMNKSLNEISYPSVVYKPVLLGISRACLKNESFLAAASFQETRRILTEAAIEGKIDWLFGVKESIIVGKLIPAGTGFSKYINDIDSSFSITQSTKK